MTRWWRPKEGAIFEGRATPRDEPRFCSLVAPHKVGHGSGEGGGAGRVGIDAKQGMNLDRIHANSANQGGAHEDLRVFYTALHKHEVHSSVEF